MNDRRCAVTVGTGFNRTGCNLSGGSGTCEVEAAARRQKYAEASRTSFPCPQAAERDATIVFLDYAPANPEAKASTLG